MELNQKFLLEEIEKLEKSYVTSTIELIKLPIFLEQINKEIKTNKNKDKVEQLKKLIENNKMQEVGHKESLENLEKILKEVYKLKK